MNRDKEATKKKLLDSVGKVILRDGFAGIGVNSIAKEAGVDKVLIYRYFDGLDGLLKAYAAQKDYYNKPIDEEPANIGTVFLSAEKLLKGQLKHILADKELQEILLWELNTKNDVTISIAQNREKTGTAFIDKISKLVDFEKFDLPAYSALIIGGIYYLTLRSRTADVFNGIDLTSEEGWERIGNAISSLLKLLKREMQKKTR